MKITWQQPPARGLGPTVLVETEGTVSRFVLKPHKDNIYLLEDVRLDKDLASAAREAVWEGFCDWMKKGNSSFCFWAAGLRRAGLARTRNTRS